MVGQLKKVYLQGPIKILHFPTPARTQKYLTQLQNTLAFLTIKPSASWVVQEISLHVIPVRILVPRFYR